MGIVAQFISGFLVGIEFDFNSEDATYVDICVGIVAFTLIFPKG